ncbi:MAG: exo-beta-N-acetylmuramidase NamZ domain-containing protein [Bacillota bacterium]
MKYLLRITAFILVLVLTFSFSGSAETPKFKLGNEVLLEKYYHLLQGKRVGLITNQSGVDSKGRSLVDIFAEDKSINLVALYGPEHGIDGIAKAGEYVESYVHKKLGIPVYSLYGSTRMPTEAMLRNVDVLVFDMQDIGSRTYTYISTLNYSMVAAQKYGKSIIVLDRPNPVGGLIVEGPVLEDKFKSFVGIDNLPMAHGMTIGELAFYFNRQIGANLTVVAMEGYTRSMLFMDTGLQWVQTSPNIPDLASVFGYMATGLGEGTGIFQADQFKWIGGRGIDPSKFADLLNQAGLQGVTFIPEMRGEAGGVRLNIIDPYSFNPARSGIYALSYARILSDFKVPKSGQSIIMFDKIMGTDKIGQYLEEKLTPQQIEQKYEPQLAKFKEERKKYLIYDHIPRRGYALGEQIAVKVSGNPISFDSPPFIDGNNRLMVPLRAIAESMGAIVHYNPLTREILISGHGRTIQFTVNSPNAIVNGEVNTMDTIPVINHSRTLAPARYVGEYLGAKVHWSPELRSVLID